MWRSDFNEGESHEPNIHYYSTKKHAGCVRYNINPDLPVPLAPPLQSLGTKKPVQPSDLAALFPPGLIEQEMSMKPTISIPGEIMDAYRLYRPTAATPGPTAREGARHTLPRSSTRTKASALRGSHNAQHGCRSGVR